MRVFIFFILLFFIELGGFVAFSEEFGFFALILEIILSGVLGVFLLFNALSGSNETIIEFLRNTRDPREAIVSNLAKVFGAILLIIPGIFGDCLGLLLQFGILDSLLLKVIAQFGFLKFQTPNQKNNFENNEEIIDVEVIEENQENRNNISDSFKK